MPFHISVTHHTSAIQSLPEAYFVYHFNSTHFKFLIMTPYPSGFPILEMHTCLWSAKWRSQTQVWRSLVLSLDQKKKCLYFIENCYLRVKKMAPATQYVIQLQIGQLLYNAETPSMQHQLFQCPKFSPTIKWCMQPVLSVQPPDDIPVQSGQLPDDDIPNQSV